MSLRLKAFPEGSPDWIHRQVDDVWMMEGWIQERRNPHRLQYALFGIKCLASCRISLAVFLNVLWCLISTCGLVCVWHNNWLLIWAFISSYYWSFPGIWLFFLLQFFIKGMSPWYNWIRAVQPLSKYHIIQTKTIFTRYYHW